MLEQWLKSQAIGLAGYAAGAFPQQIGLAATQRLCTLLDEWGWNNPRQMRSLPSSVLHVLTALDDNQILPPLKGRIQLAARTALEYLNPRQDAPLARSEILAHQIMYDSGSAKRITRLGISLTGRWGWPDLERGDLRPRLDDAVMRLRDPNGDTATRLNAIGDLQKLLLVGCPPAAMQVGNILYQHVFCWPLLMCSEAAISLPIAVDVDLSLFEDNRHWVKRKDLVITGDRAFDLGFRRKRQGQAPAQSWLDYLETSRNAACVLWAKTHGNCGRFKKNVWEHQARFDFHWASEVVGLAFGRTDTRLPIEGDSATAYFAQVVLARLLGKRWYLSSAITGAVGPRVVIRSKKDYPELPSDELDRDFEFKRVKGVKAKFHYVWTTHAFERFVLPEENAPEIAAAEPRRWGEVQAAYPARLSHVADVVQVEGWRKTHFIRCPEVAHALHGDGRLPEACLEEARQVQQQIATRGSSVLRLGSRPAAVALALAEINRQLHEQAKQKIAEQGEASGMRAGTIARRQERGHLVPGLSWCVVRCIEDEHDASFWRMLWRIIGAPLEEFERFRHSVTLEMAAQRLAAVLNGYVPTGSAPSHRAPDIIVLVGLEKLQKSIEANETPLARPLAVEPLLNELDKRGLLRASRYRHVRYLQELAGLVRFVLVPECEEDPVPQGEVTLTKDKRDVMKTLATFRFGFSQQMASLLLSEYGIYGVDVRDRLEELETAGALRYVFGQYFLSHALRECCRKDVSTDARMGARLADVEARRQAAAGVAFAPYTTVAPVAGLAYDVAFLPENVKEAEVHLKEATRLYGKLQDKSKLASVRTWFERVCRFSTVPHWGMVSLLNKAHLGKDAWELADELMEGWRRAGLPAHPSHFKFALKAAMNWEDVAFDDVKRLYEDGLAACQAYPDEAWFSEVQLAATYSVYLYRMHTHMTGAISDADRRVWSHRERWTNVPGDWFEKNGDGCKEDGDAVEHYLLGTRHAPQWKQNWVKVIGAGSLTGVDVSEVLDKLASWEQDEAMDLCRFMVHERSISKQQGQGAWVAKRWMRAFAPFCDRWHNIPACVEMLNSAIRKHSSQSD